MCLQQGSANSVQKRKIPELKFTQFKSLVPPHYLVYQFKSF